MAEQKPRKRVTDLKVHEISFVDNPAVPKARFLIVKRHEEGGGEMDLEKDTPGDEKATEKTAADLAKEAGEEVTKQQMKAMKAAREMISALMGKRGDLPPFFRRQVMEMDIAIDEFMKEREAFLTRSASTDEGEVTTKSDEEETEKAAEATEEKAGPGGPGTGKKPKPEAAIPGFEKEESSEEKAIPKKPIPKEESEEKKQEEKQCPPNMVFDEEKGKCVPKEKAKKSEEESEKSDDSAPRDGGGGDALKVAATLELSPAQKKRVDKLIEKLNKK